MKMNSQIKFYKKNEISVTPDEYTQQELEKSERKENIDSLVQDRLERKIYARKVFYLLSFWLLSILLIIILDGFKYIFGAIFIISDQVILALIGGTTINVIALFVIIVKYLFTKNNRH
jgi:hypothetical protein